MIHLGPKHYNLAMREPGGFEGILDAIQEERPEMVLICRNLHRAWVHPLIEFLDENYECYEEKGLICENIVCRLREE
jgi:hypothetical protein